MAIHYLRRTLFVPFIVLLAVALAAGGQPTATLAQTLAPAAAPAAPSDGFPLDAQALYERVASAVGVVRVTTGRSTGSGTAFTVDPSGWLVTAAHVARGADRIAVDMGDGKPLEARLAGYDARRDLALLKVSPASPLPMLEFADSSALRPGEPIAAIGNPGGRPRVMSTGRVIALQETAGGLASEIMIRFSAPVEPGNSGGPLVNVKGQVVGVVVALSFDRGGMRSGLAVSSAAVKQVYRALADGARFERAWIGIAGRTLAPDMVRARRFSVSHGILIFQVVDDSPAARAGLRADVFDGPRGDVIVAVDGKPVAEWEDLLRILGDREPGQRLLLRVARGDAQIDVAVTLAERP